MKKLYLIFLSIFIYNFVIAQVAQFPQVYYNGQGSGGFNLEIHQSASLSSSDITSLSTTSNIGAESYTTSNETDGTASWAIVCLPSTTGSLTYGYMMYGEYYARINAINNYATVTATSLNIRIAAGSSSWVTIGGANSMFGKNSIVALTGSTSNISGTIWYQVYLTNNCSQTTGWVSGTYLTINSSTTNYYNVAGEVTNSSSVVIWGATVTIGSWTTNSTEGFYQYKLPVNWTGKITCTDPSYNTSTPASYPSYSATGNNYSISFVMSNTVQTYSISGTITYSSNGNPMNGVTISATGLTSTTTNSSGFYSFTVASGYTGTVTPSYSGYSFSPTNRSFSNTTSNQTNQNFSGTNNSYTISGTITYSSNGNPMNGVTVSATGLTSTTTNSSGFYSFTVASGYTGTVTPSYSGYAFSPTNRTFSNTSSNQTNQNFSGTNNSYTISGTITYSSNGNPISGVTVSATGLTSTTTNSSGLYSFTVASGFTGTITPSYSGYSFSPTNRSFSNTTSNQTNQNFSGIASPSATISISSSDIPPWQREGDDLVGSVTADYSDIPIGSSIELDIYVNGTFAGSTAQWNTNIASGSREFDFDLKTSTLKPKPIYGNQVGYQLINNSTGAHADATQLTQIIEAQWTAHNEVLYNNTGQSINIPLQYIGTNVAATVLISRVLSPITSTSSESLHPNGGTTFPLNNYGSKYYTITIDGTNNLSTIQPGIFDILVNYYSSSGYVGSEVGQFDLTKIGNVNNLLGCLNIDPNQIVVLIGGINNTIEHDITVLANTNQSKMPKASMSIANELVFGTHKANSGQHFNTWYIATCNLNSIQKNAYDIGISIQKILNIVNSSSPEINIIAHSRGGLETRILLNGKGIPNYVSESQDNNLSLSQTYFAPSQISNSISSITFIGSPHKGANSAAWENIFCIGCANALGATDLLPQSHVINYLLGGTYINSSIRISNITGYGEQNPIFIGFGDDGLVSKYSSENPNISGSLVYQYYINDAVYLLEDLWTPFHSFLHRSLVLDDASNTCMETVSISTPPYFSVNSGTISLMDRITAIINGSNIQLSCPDPDIIQFSGETYASILSNATVSIYDQNQNYTAVGKTDENGFANFHFYDIIPFGDTILITAPGIESMKFTIDSNMIKTHSFKVPMFHILNSYALSEPAIHLINQNPITANSTIQLMLTAQNANQFFINFPYNQDSLFIPLSINTSHIATVTLDTGINILHIKFIGTLSDTADIIKTVFYFPDSLMNLATAIQTINADSSAIGAKMFVDNNYFNLISGALNTMNMLKGDHDLKFTKFGYQDSLYHIDSISSININLKPTNYSSLSDSNVIDFSSSYKTNFWKTISFLDSARQNNISIKQYNDKFSGKGLIPKSRKFEMRHLNTNWSGIRFASVLDQIENLSRDSIYLMRVYDDTLFTKIPFDTSGTIAGYDSTVQKLSYNYINFNNGKATKEALVIMKKQAPIVKNISTLNVNENDSLILPFSMFFKDPDSIQDLKVVLVNSSPLVNIKIKGNAVFIKPILCKTEKVAFTLLSEHDGLFKTVTDSVNVIDMPIPPINLIGKITFCKGDSVVLNTYSGTGLSYKWKLNNIYISGAISSAYTANTSGYYLVEVTNSNNCLATSNSIMVTVNPMPIATITTSKPTTFCQGDSVILTASPAISYLWNNGSTSQSIIVKSSEKDSVRITDINGCSATSQGTIVLVNSLPIITITNSSAIPLCQGDSVTLTANRENSYLWNNGMTSQNIKVEQAGNYSVLSADSNECKSTGNIFVSFNPLPFNIGDTVNMNLLKVNLAQKIICNGTSTNIKVINPQPGISYQLTVNGNPLGSPQAGMYDTLSFTTDTLFATTLFKVKATDTTTGCSRILDTLITVTINTAKISPNGLTKFCQGDSVTLSASSAKSYSWSNGATTQDINVSQQGDYFVTVTDEIGCTATDQINIIVNPIPLEPAVTSLLSYCKNASSTELNAIGSNLEWYYTLTGGIGDTIAPIPSTGTADTLNYYVSQTLKNCESSRANITVIINSIPLAPIVTNSVSYCQNAIATKLTATGVNILWYDSLTGGKGDTNAPIPSTINPGIRNYYVSQTVNSCESQRAMIAVTVNSIPSVPTVTSPVTYCQGETATQLIATGSNLLWYKQSSGGTENTTAPTPSTAKADTIDYYVSQTISNCESSRAMITVIVNEIPLAPIVTSPVIYCQNTNATQLTAIGNNLLWYYNETGGNGDTIAIIPSTSKAGIKNYYVSQTVNACESPRAVITIFVIEIPDAPSVISPIFYCQNTTSSQLSATGLNLLWYDTSTGGIGDTIAPIPSTINVGTTNNYVSQTMNGCESQRAKISVIINPLPQPEISGFIKVCEGAERVNYMTIDSMANYKWYVSGGHISVNDSSSVSVFWTTAGLDTIKVICTNIYGCKGSASILVTVDSLPKTPTIKQIGDSLFSSSSSGNQWYDSLGILKGDTASKFAPTKNGDYYVVVTQNGCLSKSSNIIHYVITGINNSSILSEELRIYPNPVNNELIIETSSNSILNISLTNIVGQTIFTIYDLRFTIYKIDMSKLPDGIYLIKIYNENGSVVRKVIKE